MLHTLVTSLNKKIYLDSSDRRSWLLIEMIYVKGKQTTTYRVDLNTMSKRQIYEKFYNYFSFSFYVFKMFILRLMSLKMFILMYNHWNKKGEREIKRKREGGGRRKKRREIIWIELWPFWTYKYRGLFSGHLPPFI